jgi:hypothetical protein
VGDPSDGTIVHPGAAARLRRRGGIPPGRVRRPTRAPAAATPAAAAHADVARADAAHHDGWTIRDDFTADTATGAAATTASSPSSRAGDEDDYRAGSG